MTSVKLPQQETQTWLAKFYRTSDKLMFILASIVIATLLLEYGFYISDLVERTIHQINAFVIFYFVFFNLSKLIINPKPFDYLRSRWFELLLTFLIIVQSFAFLFYSYKPYFNIQTIARIYIASVQIYLMIDIALKAIRYSRRVISRSIHPVRVLALSFLFLILAGTILLLLPKATNKGISLIDALFTATSAVCVTGLIVVDTGTHFTRFGQFIIMLLIQLGGLGIMTFTTFFALFLSGGIGIKERVFLSEILSEKNFSRISTLIIRIIFLTFTIELLGTIALYNFLPDSIFKSKSDKFFHSVFHSISAFCNAGFSTFSNNLIEIKNNIPSLLTIAILFILGGFGFVVLSELIGKPFLRALRNIKFLKDKIPPQMIMLTLHSKLTLTTTLILIALGTITFFQLEFNNTLKNEPFVYKILHSFFQAVTPRTAGFNTLDTSKFGITTSLFIMFLMWIGASPGSTGGGIKTTTFAVLILKLVSIVTGKEKVEIFGKQVSEETVTRAFASALLSIFFMSTFTFILTITEKSLDFISISFEVVSAFGTVGLSRGVTSNLTNFGKLIIIIGMFVGRIGTLAFLFAFFGKVEKRNYELQKENVLVT